MLIKKLTGNGVEAEEMGAIRLIDGDVYFFPKKGQDLSVFASVTYNGITCTPHDGIKYMVLLSKYYSVMSSTVKLIKEEVDRSWLYQYN